MADPISPAEWLSVSYRHEQSAKALVNNETTTALAFYHAGIAVECALKAYICHKERFNRYPSYTSRPDLYTHNLRKLKDLAGLKIKSTDKTAPSWHTVLLWERNQSYDPKPMPKAVAKSMLDAAFEKEGVVTWIRQNLNLNS